MSGTLLGKRMRFRIFIYIGLYDCLVCDLRVKNLKKIFAVHSFYEIINYLITDDYTFKLQQEF